MSTPSIMPFQFGQNTVRTIRKGDDVWFVAKDVADALGYSTAKDASRHLDADEKGRHFVPTLGGAQEVSIINESGLYALVLRSRKPEARKFAKWVTAEVLPSIRKTGSYRTGDALPPAPNTTPARQRVLATLENGQLVSLQPVPDNASVLPAEQWARAIEYNDVYLSPGALAQLHETVTRKITTHYKRLTHRAQ